MLAVIRKWLLILVLVLGVGFLLYQGYLYLGTRRYLPLGTTIADLDVSGLTVGEARDLINEQYLSPIFLYHRQEHVELNPRDIGFSLDMDSMISRVQDEISAESEWLRFSSFLLKRPLRPISVPLMASHDDAGLGAMIESVSNFLDEPAQSPQFLSQNSFIKEGQSGFTTDVEASIRKVERALYKKNNRVVDLVIQEDEAPTHDLKLLEEVINGKLHSFDGLGSIFILDLQSGEELSINADVVMSGLSILKIGIFVEAFRAIDGPLNDYEKGLFLDTATRSSNFGANLLLHVVAGEDNTYKGADTLTESMQRLGLINTFMAVPYDASPPAYRRTTYVTPANSRTDITTQPDETMQTTAEEIGSLLEMIYHCSRGGGALLAIYPGEITPNECQQIIDFMILNEEGNLIRFGVPEDVPVSHKHGWALGTHADAGIVFSPGGDYIIVEYLNQPGEWLLADESFPILREIARATYNFFNMEDPYLGDRLNDDVAIDLENPFSETRLEDAEADLNPDDEDVNQNENLDSEIDPISEEG